eukprot:1184965-Prorocentrum_minimum.AAC.1
MSENRPREAGPPSCPVRGLVPRTPVDHPNRGPLLLYAQEVNSHTGEVNSHAREVNSHTGEVNSHAREVNSHAREVNSHAGEVNSRASYYAGVAPRHAIGSGGDAVAPRAVDLRRLSRIGGRRRSRSEWGGASVEALKRGAERERNMRET